jgi:hypothetical protein
MSARDHACFGYRIREEGAGWSWTTFDLAGRVQARGHAPNKAVAAACVIRMLARSAIPDARTAA